MSKQKSGNMLPGMEEFLDEEEEYFFGGEKIARYFDAMTLPDIPNYQSNAEGTATHTLYIVFPDRESITRALTALTKRGRKTLPAAARIGTLNGVAVMKDGLTLLETWERDMLGIEPQQEESDPDEAQAPI